MARMYERLRETMCPLPWAIIEAIIGNVVVGNYDWDTARMVARVIHNHLAQIERASLAHNLGSPND